MRYSMLLIIMIGFAFCGDEYVPKVKDLYAEFYVTPKMLEGSLNGEIDGLKKITGQSGWIWSRGPAKNPVNKQDKAFARDPKVTYATVLNYTLVIKADAWKAFVAKGGSEKSINEVTKEFLWKYEIKSPKWMHSILDIHVDERNEVRNAFYEGINNHIATTIGQPTVEKNIVRLSFYRHTPDRDKLKPEQLAPFIQDLGVDEK